MASPFSTTALVQGMADALPTHQLGDESSDMAGSMEVIALLAHAYLTALKFRLEGFKEDEPLEECRQLAPRLPPQWNRGGSITFVYRHKQSSLQFVFRVDRMGAKFEVRGLAVGDEKIHRFEGVMKNSINGSKLPLRISMTDEGEDRSDLAARIRDIFTGEDAVQTLVRSLRENIVQKLIPKLQIEGYVETGPAEGEEGTTTTSRIRETERPVPLPGVPFRPPVGPVPLEPLRDPLALPTPGPSRFRPPVDFPPPQFEDEHGMAGDPRMVPFLGGYYPNIGADDLNPPGIGPFDPLRPPEARGRRPGGMSGMHPTFDDPLFTGQGGDGRGGGGGNGQGQGQGQGQYDPQVPPGARWDPIGPGGGPRMPPFGRGGGNGGGGFSGTFF